MGSTEAMIGLGVMTGLEAVGDLVPAIDTLLDTVMIVVRPIAGFMIATAP